MIKYADVVSDLSWGDTGKGKVTSYLAKNNKYDYVCRWAGGNNAGHTVFIGDNKYKTHLVPSGVFHGIKSVIGPSCVVNYSSLMEEINYLSSHGFDTSLIKVSPRCHMVLDHHLSKDKKELSEKLGTTSKGIAPCYSDKMARVGVLAKNVLPSDLLLKEEVLSGKILCEGAQGFYLDIDWGNYPYVTSSITLPYGACSIGFSPKKIRNIWGIAKIYDTRSGVDPLFPDSLFEDEELLRLGDLGQEKGVTTGRRRHVNWLRLDYLLKAANVTGTTHLVINKCDILEQLGIFKLFLNENSKNPIRFTTMREMQDFIKEKITTYTNINKQNIFFSYSKEQI